MKGGRWRKVPGWKYYEQSDGLEAKSVITTYWASDGKTKLRRVYEYFVRPARRQGKGRGGR